LLSVQQGKEVEVKCRRFGSSFVLPSSKSALRLVVLPVGCPTRFALVFDATHIYMPLSIHGSTYGF
jgi:hypothetical protein